MNINNLGLLNILGEIINEEEESSDKAISEFLLYNIDNIRYVTINNIVDQAFVSHSSVRRFCNNLGYQNFSELKSSFSDIVFPSNLHLRKFEPVEKYRVNIVNELENIIVGINHVITDDTIKYLTHLINQYENIALLSANNTSSNLLKFQQELFYANKIIRIVNNNFDNEFLNEVSKRSSLIFVVSVSGVFAKEIYNIMDHTKGKKVLITANRDEEFIKPYNEIIYLSKKDIKSDAFGLFGKYGITYLFDLISEHYIYEYKKRNEKIY
ncbi:MULTISPECIES: MurR/RpiR family transcriptional regulator [Clostridia]|uniref:MurR/RpiR family transcriptional regulator n=1 Tax=Clostridia TaxID=186801 RepID=UPI000EA02F78|nr:MULTISPECIES: MurR/RpiR family transcriptional regulator [Clostridia]NBJ70703.1 MurR/RpiR family transcriptional regulator [Roseburia sp. 1XD42-34]RKI76818.1 MurR/RpiR family transcriptional regulator [Clostridium sp. 1xD42-85]